MKKVISIIIVILLISTMIPLTLISVNATAWDGTVATSFASGDGTEGNPYVIATAGQLAYLAQTVNAGTTYAGQYVVVAADIDLGNNEWRSIGFYDFIEGSSVERAFKGTFDGQGHTIGNMKITAHVGESAKKRIGLFGLTRNAAIRNLTLENFEFNISDTTMGCYLGSVVGEAINCVISNIIIANTVTMNSSSGTQSYSVGGIAGRAEETNISYCINNSNTGTGKIDSNSTSANAGGIVGATIGRSFISNCINYGDFKTTSAFNGGIVGIMGASGGTVYMTTLENCINYGNITSDTATRYVGGIVGSLAHSDNGTYTMRNVYNAGTITGGKTASGYN